MRPRVVGLVAVLFLSSGCRIDTSAIAVDNPTDSGTADVPADTGTTDASLDTGTTDSGVADTASDCGTATGYAFAKTITLDRTQIDDATCSATLADFPLLYSVIDADLRDGVTNPDGDDIIFVGTDDPTCGAMGPAPCTLDHEIERWVAATGELIAWVRLPSVNTHGASGDTTVEIRYGDASVTTSTQNSDGVWDSNYQMVLHAAEAATPLLDSSGNGNDASEAGTPSYRATGQIGYGVDLEASDSADRFRVTGLTMDPSATDWTLEAWVSFESLGSTEIIFAQANGTGAGRSNFAKASGDELHSFVGGAITLGDTSLGAGTFHHAVVRYDATSNAIHFFLDGDSDSADLSITAESANGSWFIGSNKNEASQFLDGILDELRVSDVLRSACAIDASYDNQNLPGDVGSAGFYAVGAERPGAAPCL